MSDVLPTETNLRKDVPLATGVIDYFPDALVAVAELSKIGNDKHNPGEPLHWSRDKSNDHPDCLMRHFVDRGKIDTDGVRHSVKVAWRALAILQLELEAATADFDALDQATVATALSSWRDKQWERISALAGLTPEGNIAPDVAAQKAIEGDDRWADDGGPVPEPKPKAPNFKVGDWVRCTCSGCFGSFGVRGKITRVSVGNEYLLENGSTIRYNMAVADKESDVRLAA